MQISNLMQHYLKDKSILFYKNLLLIYSPYFFFVNLIFINKF